ncbi:carotenoid oxygenase family protein [Fodinicola acaciae]|uniref:carotenoid oxygenase family protein n=1 Tax=Fodinicola acaciae TaxID=2681555 RepID=UPI0013D0217E|nr:carotenoid oxygenase family protein [Fodinicola acaciae]
MTTTEPGIIYPEAYLAPVPDETEAFDLPVTGTLPAELTGRYFRNGPNPLPGDPSHHWFIGRGMLHGVRIAGGRAEWYRNRWVRTQKGDFIDERGRRDFAVNSANTHIIEHSGRLLALCEAGFPYEVTPELDTLGPVDFGGRLSTAMTAHPKQDPVTGELHFFGYGATPPFLTYHRLSADGELVHSAEIEVPGPTMMHDFGITENHVLWLDLPIVFDFAMLGKGMPYVWNDAYGARIGVMPKKTGEVRWFDVEPGYVFHVGNASEDITGRIVLDAVRYSRKAWDTVWGQIGGQVEVGKHLVDGATMLGVAAMHRWTFDTRTGHVTEQQLDDRSVEFPTINESRVGLPNRFVYAVGNEANGRIVKYDTTSGASTGFDLGDRMPGEAVFIPAAGARNEDDGWLMSIVSDRAGRGSELVVLDAGDVAGGPVATVQLPRRVPAGFHGSWIPDEEE